jgi:hypothetical protein
MSRLFDAEEIQTFAENDGDFYSEILRPTLFMLVRLQDRKSYDEAKGLRAFRQVADAAAKWYWKELARQEPRAFATVPWHVLFEAQEREKAAQLWEQEFRQRYRLGQYSKKPNQKARRGN